MSQRAIKQEEALMWLNDARDGQVHIRVEVDDVDVLETFGVLTHWTQDPDVRPDSDMEELMGAYQIGDDLYLKLSEPGLGLPFRLRPHLDFATPPEADDRIVAATPHQAGEELVIPLGQANLIISRVTANAELGDE